MNKKFSTLVASILLASSVGAYAQITAPLTFKVAGSGVTAGAFAPNNDGKNGYVEGRAYFLNAGTNGYLSVKEVAGKVYLITKEFASDKFTSITDANKALWVLEKIDASAGAVAPKYTFINKATSTYLSVDKSQVDKSIVLGGSQMDWLSADSYKNPQAAPFYASISNDEVIVFAAGDAAGSAITGEKYVKLVKKSAGEKATGTLSITPYVSTAGASLVLTPHDLNTLMDAAGSDATKDSYFQLSFSPAATMDGGANRFADDLQAVAVQQFEQKYGEDNTAVINTPGGSPASLYASLYPRTSKALGTDKFGDLLANEAAVNATDVQWVALRNRDGQYLVVDTIPVKGTSQTGTPRLTFAWDKLYNAKESSRYRDPRSYLFAFHYNPATGNVDIKSMAYVKDKSTTKITSGNETVLAGVGNWYDNGYVAQPKAIKSEWYADNSDANVVMDAYVSRAALAGASEVTMSKNDVLPTGESYFTIKLGNSGAYQPTYIQNGVYLLKVTASTTASRVGKYYVDNLKGGFEIMEQAVRQDFQHMPAAQWVVKSATYTNGSPVSIVNREFNVQSGLPANVKLNGTVYSAGVNQAFFMNGDVLEFIKVTAPLDEKLGYKYVANDTISESLFTFNYLHDLAMDKPINTKTDKDSVVWVDKNGDATKFMLEVVADDTYGTNNGVSGVSKNLTRRVYKVRINDATKLQNDKRYLAYDADIKKYKVTEGSDKADMFFLKENNTADGSCYYTFIKANVYPSVTLNQPDKTATVVTSRNGMTVSDAEASSNMYLAKYAKYIDILDGLDKEGWVLATFADATKAEESASYDVRIFDIVTLDGAIASEKSTDKVVLQFKPTVKEYADYKVSVDNNTLDLVNGVLNNQNSQEVATSAFAVKRDADPLYRRFNTVNEGIATDAPDTVKFYRVNASVKEYLYEDANSSYSKDKGFNFLGVEGKGDVKNASIYVDTAYVRNNTSMPQYMLALRPTFVKGETILCDATTHAHATPAEALACPHTKITPTYVDATYLVNLQDSIDTHAGAIQAKYQWNKQYTRLGFVDARHIHDTLVIKNSIYTGNNNPIQIGKATTWASKDSIFLGNNMHKNVVFSFRMVKSGSNNFLIESETEQDGANVKNSALKATKIAPEFGGWVKIQNGVPVIANKMKYSEVGLDAEIFNVEATSEAPTTNEGIDATTVSIVAGNGNVTVKNAEGKSVAISNILGQSIVNTVITSDNATIFVPAGIVVVSVEGEDAVKAIVK